MSRRASGKDSTNRKRIKQTKKTKERKENMKKLTAGIFATILGVTAMGAADAAVTSKGYVDAALATKANASAS